MGDTCHKRRHWIPEGPACESSCKGGTQGAMSTCNIHLHVSIHLHLIVQPEGCDIHMLLAIDVLCNHTHAETATCANYQHVTWFRMLFGRNQPENFCKIFTTNMHV